MLLSVDNLKRRVRKSEEVMILNLTKLRQSKKSKCDSFPRVLSKHDCKISKSEKNAVHKFCVHLSCKTKIQIRNGFKMCMNVDVNISCCAVILLLLFIYSLCLQTTIIRL